MENQDLKSDLGVSDSLDVQRVWHAPETLGFEDYQRLAMTAAAKSESMAETLAVGSMGLAGESGEVVDYLKKVLFHGHPLDRSKIEKELGDVCWYLALLCEALGLSLREVCRHNLEKLAKRYPDGFSPAASLNRQD